MKGIFIPQLWKAINMPHRGGIFMPDIETDNKNKHGEEKDRIDSLIDAGSGATE